MTQAQRIKELQKQRDDFRARYEGERIGRMKFEADSISLLDLVERLKTDNTGLLNRNQMLRHRLASLRNKHTDLVVRYHQLEEGKR